MTVKGGQLDKETQEKLKRLVLALESMTKKAALLKFSVQSLHTLLSAWDKLSGTLSQAWVLLESPAVLHALHLSVLDQIWKKEVQLQKQASRARAAEAEQILTSGYPALSTELAEILPLVLSLEGLVQEPKRGVDRDLKLRISGLATFASRWLGELRSPTAWPEEVIEAREACGIENRVAAEIDIAAGRGLAVLN